MKKINKWFWVWNLEEEKQFLETKAKEGLILKGVKLGSYYFEESNPQKLVYQMDFKGIVQKISEDEYIQLYEDAGWHFVARLGSWYYFCQEGNEGIDLSIFNDNSSKAAVYKRIMAFLLLTGFPLYFQVIFIFPNLSNSSLEFPNFHFFIRIFMIFVAILHFSAFVKIYSMHKQAIGGIKE